MSNCGTRTDSADYQRGLEAMKEIQMTGKESLQQEAEAAWEEVKAQMPKVANAWILDLCKMAFIRGFKEGRK